MFVDLHLHTNFSDGTYTPEELVLEAQKHGLCGIALTDHDTVEGCARAEHAARAVRLDFICGSELTAELEGEEIHVLGYLLDTSNIELLDAMAKFQTVRQDRVREMVARLNRLNIPLRTEDVFGIANCRAPGRPHVARALVAHGHCGNIDEAFERFLKKSRPAWVPKFKMSATDAIALIHRSGGVTVLAHPGLNRVDERIPKMIEAGLDGLECYHTRHSTSTSEHYVAMAQRHGLLITGGSDCHGMSKGRPLIGTIRLPARNVELLRERASRYQSSMQH